MNETRSDAGKNQMFEDFNAVIGEAGDLLRSASTMGADSAAALHESSVRGLAGAADRIEKIRTDALAEAGTAATAADRYVHEKPWQAVGIAAAAAAVVGLIAGMLISRR